MNTTTNNITKPGNYNKANCRWATRSQQQRNTRRNRFVMANGRLITLAEYAEQTGVKYDTLRKRLDRGEWLPDGQSNGEEGK